MGRLVMEEEQMGRDGKLKSMDGASVAIGAVGVVLYRQELDLSLIRQKKRECEGIKQGSICTINMHYLFTIKANPPPQYPS